MHLDLPFSQPIPWSQEAKEKEPIYDPKKSRFWFPITLEHPLQQLIEKCTSQDPKTRPLFQQILAELNQIISLVGIKDDEGRKFWNTINPRQETISLSHAIELILRHYPPKHSVKSDKLLYGRAVLASIFKGYRGKTGSPHTLSASRFGYFLDWFAPLDSAIYERIVHALEQEAFWGETSSDFSDRAIRENQSYLIRLSCHTVRGHFTLDYFNREKNIPMRRRLIKVEKYNPFDPLAQFDFKGKALSLKGLLGIFEFKLLCNLEPLRGSPYFASTFPSNYGSNYEIEEDIYQMAYAKLDFLGFQ